MIENGPNTDNVNPGFINPWLINSGCPFLVGDSDHFWREHPPNHGTGLLILGQHLRCPVARRWPGEKRASFFWLVEFKGNPSFLKKGKKGTTGQLGHQDKARYMR